MKYLERIRRQDMSSEEFDTSSQDSQQPGGLVGLIASLSGVMFANYAWGRN